MKQLIAIILVLWAVLYIGGAEISGEVEHIEGDYTDEGTKVYWVWIDGEEYMVESEEFALYMYTEGVAERISVG